MDILNVDSSVIVSVVILLVSLLLFAVFCWWLIKKFFYFVFRDKDDKWQTVYLSISEEGELFPVLWRRKHIPRYNHLQLPEDDSYEDPIFEPMDDYPSVDGFFISIKAQINRFHGVVKLLLEPDENPPMLCPGNILLDGNKYSVLLNVPPVKH